MRTVASVLGGILIAAGALGQEGSDGVESVDKLREDLEALRLEYDQKLADLQARLDASEDEENPWRLWKGFSFLGYLRAGYGVDDDGRSFDPFRAPNARAKYRLGNEAETYLETLFRQTVDFDEANDTLFYTQILVAYSIPFSRSGDFDTDISLREAFAVAEGIWKGNPTTKFWGGQRFYDRHQFHMNDFWYRDLTGFGGGVEDISIGEVGDVALAWIGGSIDELRPNGSVRADDEFQFNKNTLDLRVYELDVLGGTLMTAAGMSFFEGDTFTFEGDSITVDDSEGFYVNLQHDYSPRSWLHHSFVAQFGTGPASDFQGVLTAPPGVTVETVDDLDLDDAWTLRFTNNLLIDTNTNWDVMLLGLYEELDNGLDTGERIRWVSAGIRPTYYFNAYFSVEFEAAWDYTDQEDGPEGSLGKFTVAPQIKPDWGLLSRPALRLFFTYALWSDDFEGLVSPASYGDDQDGLAVGVQIESWW